MFMFFLILLASIFVSFLLGTFVSAFSFQFLLIFLLTLIVFVLFLTLLVCFLVLVGLFAQ
ncbi:MAG: hypothetical protein ACHQ03_05735 [Candidatus Bathyarchaeia archaeon]